MSLESLRETSRAMTPDQITAGMVIGLQWVAQFIEDELFASLTMTGVTREQLRTLEIVREWISDVADGLINDNLGIGRFEVGGSIHD